MKRWAIETYRQARRVAIGVLGGTVILIGVALIFLPGPAFVVIPLGLAILGVEFAWARRWLKKMRRSLEGVANRVAQRRRGQIDNN